MTTLNNGGDRARPQKPDRKVPPREQSTAAAKAAAALLAKTGDTGLSKGFDALSDFATAEEAVAKVHAESTSQVFQEFVRKADSKDERDERQRAFQEEMNQQRKAQGERMQGRHRLCVGITTCCCVLGVATLAAIVLRAK